MVDRGDPGCATAFDADEVHTPECNDGIDNDNDGWIDTDDLICSTNSVLFEDDGYSGFTDCNDGVDSDGDGLVDSSDLGCEDSFDTDETDPLTECNDGIDNDGDGWIDLSDPICVSVAVEFEDDGVNPSGGQCNDGIDNDFDTDIDSNDIHCQTAQDTSEAF